MDIPYFSKLITITLLIVGVSCIFYGWSNIYAIVIGILLIIIGFRWEKIANG